MMFSKEQGDAAAVADELYFPPASDESCADYDASASADSETEIDRQSSGLPHRYKLDKPPDHHVVFIPGTLDSKILSLRDASL